MIREVGLGCFIENQLRFLSFALYRRSGMEAVQRFLSKLKKNDKMARRVTRYALHSICKGIRAEIVFYGALGPMYQVIPSLDVGCSCDFLGISDGNVYCIDATTNIECKLDKQLPLTYGDLKWPYRIALVNDDAKGVRLYRQTCAGGVDVIRVDALPKIKSPTLMPSLNIKRAYNFYLARYIAFAELFGQHVTSSICGRPPTLTAEERVLLNLHIRFFKAFQYALNLMPMLSAGDDIDFIGQHGGCFECYHVIGTEKIWRHSFSTFVECSRGYCAKVVREIDGVFLFDDPSDLTIFQPEEPNEVVNYLSGGAGLRSGNSME